MRQLFHIFALFLIAAATTATAQAELLITEVHTKSQTDPEDFFELTNTGTIPVDISGWQFDDENPVLAEAVPLVGVSIVNPGESIVIFQVDENDPNDPAYDPAGETTLFRNYWGGLTGVQVGYHAGAGLGKGDAITLFDNQGVVQLMLEYGMTTPNQTHAGDWAAGNTDGSDTFENQSAVWVPGTDPQEWLVAGPGVLGSFANADGDFGSPGAIVPEPTAMGLAAIASVALALSRRKQS